MSLPTIGWLCQTLDCPLPRIHSDSPLGPISIDTRTIAHNDIFWSLKAVRDGHLFVAAAFEAGAKAAIVSEEWARTSEAEPYRDRLIVVSDTRKALMHAGQSWRTTLSLPVIGITGSNGKTSTKDLLLKLLAIKFKTSGTVGNLNNELGVPLTLLSIPTSTQIAVVEMGASNNHEVGQLCEICKPTHGLVTSIGKAHLEGFGTLEILSSTKGELYDYVASSGIAFVPTDDPLCVSESSDVHERIGYGFSDAPQGWNAEFHRGETLQFNDMGCAEFRFHGARISMQIPGRPSAIAALASLTVANKFGLSVEDCANVVSEWQGVKGRSEVLRIGQILVINDSYNANPVSVRAALELLTMIPARRRIALLGDMGELGDSSSAEHKEIGASLGNFSITRAILVGSLSRNTYESALARGVDAVHYKNVDELETHLPELIAAGDVVLVKGSRFMQLERAVHSLQSVFN